MIPEAPLHPETPRHIVMLRFFSEYFWWILKNIIGWLLMLAAWPIGFLFPGPGGFPLFIIGFALITFPGKRSLTARVLRGHPPFKHSERPVLITRIIFSFVVALLTVLYLQVGQDSFLDKIRHATLYVSSMAVLMLVGSWILTWLGLPLLNWMLRLVPHVRRRIRPWMKRHGIDLLPPRRRRRLHPRPGYSTNEDEDILEFSDSHHERLQRWWSILWPWAKRLSAVALIAGIFYWMIRPVVDKWPDVKVYVRASNSLIFLIAAMMFTVFLYLRAITWRRIVEGFGHRLPLPSAVRIWSSSELARYVPGSVLQFMGRVYLANPYGVPRAITITSQILELSAFLLANVVIAVTCLLWYFSKIKHTGTRLSLYIAIALVPLLGFFLHPKVFYGIVNGLRARFNKSPITVRLSGRVLAKLFFLSILMLLWQSLAVWLLTHDGLHLKIDWWWRVAGAYCLAWCAGFLVPIAPGGLGVREVVFYFALLAALPNDIKQYFPDPSTLKAYIKYLGVLLRLWTIAGELLLFAIAIIGDHKGFFSGPTPPNRKSESTLLPEPQRVA